MGDINVTQLETLRAAGTLLVLVLALSRFLVLFLLRAALTRWTRRRATFTFTRRGCAVLDGVILSLDLKFDLVAAGVEEQVVGGIIGFGTPLRRSFGGRTRPLF